MAGQGVSGKYGDVKIGSTSLAEASKWDFDTKADIKKYASNATGGYKKAVVGNLEGSGNLEGKWVPSNPVIVTIAAGTAVTLKLYVTTTQYWEVPAVISTFKHMVDIESGDVIGWTAGFEADGQWTNPVQVLRLPRGSKPDAKDPNIDQWRFEPAGQLKTAAVPPLQAAASLMGGLTQEQLQAIVAATTQAVLLSLNKAATQPQGQAA